MTTLQILAHHTDFPEPEEAGGDPDKAYQPFLAMLQFAFEALLLPLPSGLNPAGLPACLCASCSVTVSLPTQEIPSSDSWLWGAHSTLICSPAPPQSLCCRTEHADTVLMVGASILGVYCCGLIGSTQPPSLSLLMRLMPRFPVKQQSPAATVCASLHDLTSTLMCPLLPRCHPAGHSQVPGDAQAHGGCHPPALHRQHAHRVRPCAPACACRAGCLCT